MTKMKKIRTADNTVVFALKILGINNIKGKLSIQYK